MSNNILELMQYVQREGERGTARRKQNALAQLGGDYAGGRAPDADFYRGVAENGGNPLAFRDDAHQQEERLRQSLSRDAAMLLAIRDPAQKSAAYRANLPKYRHFFQQAPDDYTPDLDPVLQQLAGVSDQVKPMNVSPGGQVIDPRTGRVIHSNDNFAPKGDVWDPSRGAWITRPAAHTTAQPPPGAPQKQFTLSNAALEALAQVPEAERATALQAMLTGGDFHTGPDGQPVQGLSADASSDAGPRAIVPANLPPRQPNAGITVNTGDQVKPFQKALGELQAKNLVTWQEDSIIAQDAIAKIGVLRQITALQQTGKVQEAQALVGQYFGTQAGANMQAFNATVGPMVIDLASKLKPLSNADIAFVRTAMPRFGNDPRANKQIMELLEGAAHRQVRLYEDAARYAEEHESLDGFRPPAYSQPRPKASANAASSGPTATDPKTGRQVQWNGRAWVTIKPGDR